MTKSETTMMYSDGELLFVRYEHEDGVECKFYPLDTEYGTHVHLSSACTVEAARLYQSDLESAVAEVESVEHIDSASIRANGPNKGESAELASLLKGLQRAKVQLNESELDAAFDVIDDLEDRVDDRIRKLSNRKQIEDAKDDE